MTKKQFYETMNAGFLLVAVFFLGNAVYLSFLTKEHENALLALAATCFCAFISKYFDERMQ